MLVEIKRNLWDYQGNFHDHKQSRGGIIELPDDFDVKTVHDIPDPKDKTKTIPWPVNLPRDAKIVKKEGGFGVDILAPSPGVSQAVIEAAVEKALADREDAQQDAIALAVADALKKRDEADEAAKKAAAEPAPAKGK